MHRKAKRAVIVIGLFVAAGLMVLVGWDLYKKEQWPCKHRSYASLMTEYPSLIDIWNRKIAYLDTREAAEKILSAKLELAVKRGFMTDTKAFEREQKMFEQTMAVDEEFERQFQAECKRLTGTE